MQILIQSIILMAQLNTPPVYSQLIAKNFICNYKSKPIVIKFVDGQKVDPPVKVRCEDIRTVMAYKKYLNDKGVDNYLEDIFGSY